MTALAQQPKNDLFTRLDANKDGKVVRDELPENQKPNFGKIDANSDGAISQSELSAFTRRGGEAVKPTHTDVAYGPHERNKIDLYLVESKTPTPLVLFIPGGGFRGGDKSSVNAGEIRAFHREGWSVAAINYRFTNVLPAPGQYLDCGRALQFLRHHAKEYNFDPKLVLHPAARPVRGLPCGWRFTTTWPIPIAMTPSPANRPDWCARSFPTASRPMIRGLPKRPAFRGRISSGTCSSSRFMASRSLTATRQKRTSATKQPPRLRI